MSFNVIWKTVFIQLFDTTHSLTAALDQLRVVASSTSNDPGPRSRQHQQTPLFKNFFHKVCVCVQNIHGMLKYYTTVRFSQCLEIL